MTAKRILIWRHGRTEWNASGRIQGQTDVALDAVGIRQAREAAAVLATEKPDVIIASDLSRAVATANELATLLGLPVRTDKRLRERHFGLWEGLTGDEVTASYPEQHVVWRNGGEPDVPGFETDAQLALRMMEGVRAALETTEGTVCVATHGGAARRAVNGLLEWPDEFIDFSYRLEPLGNCRWEELRRGSKGWRLYAHNIGPMTGVAGPHTPVPTADVDPGGSASADDGTSDATIDSGNAGTPSAAARSALQESPTGPQSGVQQGPH